MDNREYILDVLSHEVELDVAVNVEGHSITIARNYSNGRCGLVMNPVFLENTDIYHLEFFHFGEQFRGLFRLHMKDSGQTYVIHADICPEMAEGETRYVGIKQTTMPPLPTTGPIPLEEAKTITTQMGHESIELGRVMLDENNCPYYVSHTWYPGESGDIQLYNFDVRDEGGVRITSASYYATNFDGMEDSTISLTFNESFEVIRHDIYTGN